MNNLFNIAYLKQHNRWHWLVVASCVCLFIGLACARALASIGMIALLIAPFLFNNPFDIVKKYISRKELWILALYFLIVFASGLYSEDKKEWMNWVRIKLPYIALPLAFAGISKLDNKKFIIVLYGFILTFFAVTVFILVRYALNYEEVTLSYQRGATIAIPYSHIRYTIMLAFSFFCSLYLVHRNYFVISAKEKWLQLFFAAFAFIALHIISVRSGLLALYVGIVVLALYLAFNHKKYVLGLGMIAAIVAMPYIAYKYVPSFTNKVNYMRYDMGEYEKGNYNNLSDAIRIISTKVGIDIWKQSPAIGVGAGDIRTETAKVYEQQFPQLTEYNRKVPHNQLVWVLATTGVVGLVLFLIAFFVPLFTNGLYKFWPALVLHLILHSSFFTEDTFEEQIGTGFYLIFLLLFINYNSKHE